MYNKDKISGKIIKDIENLPYTSASEIMEVYMKQLQQEIIINKRNKTIDSIIDEEQ